MRQLRKMKPNIEQSLRNLIEEKTENVMSNEWKSAQERSKVPLFNYRLDHIQETVEICKMLGNLMDADMRVLIPAAWLHDLSKPGIGEIENHGNKSAQVAADILADLGMKETQIERVQDIITKHVGLIRESKLEPIEAQILWEADKLVKLGATGLVYFLLNGLLIEPGTSLRGITKKFQGFLPLAEKIAKSMISPTSKRMAATRLEILYKFSEALNSELFQLQRWAK